MIYCNGSDAYFQSFLPSAGRAGKFCKNPKDAAALSLDFKKRTPQKRGSNMYVPNDRAYYQPPEALQGLAQRFGCRRNQNTCPDRRSDNDTAPIRFDIQRFKK
ncbi:MAG: hypothetical protein AAGU74_09805 [Bacillota bacterium]